MTNKEIDNCIREQIETQIQLTKSIKDLHQKDKNKARNIFDKLFHAYYIYKCNKSLKMLYKWKIKLI